MTTPATIVYLLTLHLFGACVYAAQLDTSAISADCRQHCVSLSMVVDFGRCLAECFQIYEEIGSDDNRMSPSSAFPEFSSESQQQHRPSAVWPPQRQPASRDDAIVDRKRLSLSPRAASLVGSGMAHQYLRIGRSYGGSQTGKSSLLDEEASMSAAAGSRYPIERRNVNSLTGSRLASAAKSYLRVGKKDAETPEAPSSS